MYDTEYTIVQNLRDYFNGANLDDEQRESLARLARGILLAAETGWPDHDRVTCPHCDGYGDEPAAPHDSVHGTPVCSLCDGYGEVSTSHATEYAEDMTDA